jgi:hypothetical protein
MEWYRAYHGMPHDPKLQVVAKRSKQPMACVVAVWVCVLDAASQHDPRGVINIDAEEIAVVMDMELEAVEAVIQSFRDKKMLDENNHLTAWDKRQHTSSTERSRKSRATKKTDATDGDTKQRGATKGNKTQRKNSKKAPDTDTDSDTYSDAEENTDTDKKQNKKRNREREEKKESEKEKHRSCGKDAKGKQSGQILEQMLDIWNAEVQSKLTNGHKAKLTPRRKELMTCRWLEDFQQDIRAWEYYCEVIGQSDFCLGKIEGKGWTIDLTWAVDSSEHVAKILEGGFSNGKHPSKPPSCEVAELQEAWDFVIGRLQHKFGKPSIRSWFGNTTITQITSVTDGSIVRLECPRKFICDWIEKHFLTEVNAAFNDQPHYHIPIITTELTIKE